MPENKNLLLLYIICIIYYFYISDKDIIYLYDLMRWPYLEVLLYCIYIQTAAFYCQFLAEVARRLILVIICLLIHYLFIKFKK